MENDQIELEPQTGAAVNVFFGERFRKARQELSLSVEDVAAHLRLTCQLVQDIEADNFANSKRHLVFMRGYLRAYSKLVGLPADEMIATFNAMEIVKVTEGDSEWQTAVSEALVQDKSNYRKIFFYFASTVLLLGILIWLTQGHHLNQFRDFVTHASTSFAQVSARATSMSTHSENINALNQKAQRSVSSSSYKTSQTSLISDWRQADASTKSNQSRLTTDVISWEKALHH